MVYVLSDWRSNHGHTVQHGRSYCCVYMMRFVLAWSCSALLCFAAAAVDGVYVCVCVLSGWRAIEPRSCSAACDLVVFMICCVVVQCISSFMVVQCSMWSCCVHGVLCSSLVVQCISSLATAAVDGLCVVRLAVESWSRSAACDHKRLPIITPQSTS